MESNNRTIIKKLLLILGGALALYLLNFFIFSDNPGFLNGPFNPYTALTLMVAAYYGRLYGLIAYILTILLIMIPISRDSSLLEYWNFLWEKQNIRFIILLVGVYLIGMIRDTYTAKISHYKDLTGKYDAEKSALKDKIETLSAVNHELEERVLRQTESVTSLYTQIKALHTQNLTETLNVLLKIVKKFSWAEKASIWRFDQSSFQLFMIANIGWQPQDYDNTIVNIDESIEGWSFRNNMIFSVKMLLEYNYLSKMDKKRNIFTIPINFSNNSWGVLNIEEMPLSKNNLYVEKMLSILVDLAAPEIERAVDYETDLTIKEPNPFTNLPIYSQFYNMLEKTIVKAASGNNSFSIVLLEILNFSEILNEFGEEKAFKLILEVLDKLKFLSSNKVDFYHFKEQNQFAIYYPNIDYDGISMFCLETLGIINNTDWEINDSSPAIEAILGYSSFGHQNIPVEELISVAEHLLEMQKV